VIFPPSFLRLRSRRPGRRGWGLWLPLFLLWPLVLVFVLLVSLIAVPVFLVSGRWRRVLDAALLGPRLFVVFCRFRRLLVHVRDEEQELLISVV